MSIPKVIHYCWFGRNELSPIAKKCISSWRKLLPDYQIIEWNEDNFDINITLYTEQAYSKKKYAFVSDYARFYALYNFGGIYMDIDVEVVKSLDCLLENKAFMGFENEKGVAPGLILASEKNNQIFKDIMEVYEKEKFIKSNNTLNMKTVVEYTTEILIEYGLVLNNEMQLVGDVMIYPSEYFSPKNMDTGKINIKKNTYTIHHYFASWLTPYQKFKKAIQRVFGVEFLIKLSKIKRYLLKRW